MITDIEAATASLLELPPRDRLRIGEALIESVGGFVEDDVADSWNAEIERRVAELRSGAVSCIPAEEVFAKIDELLAKRGYSAP